MKAIAPSLDDHLKFFADKIGVRPAGSKPYHRAADYIRKHFTAAGLHVEELQFDCVDWQGEQTLLECAGIRLPAAANVYSTECDLTAPIIPLCTVAELEAADIQCKIPLFYGDLSSEPLIPINCQVYNTERDQRINSLIIEKQPAAILMVNLRRPAVDSLIEDVDHLIPSATVPADTGLFLLDHVTEPVHLVIRSKRLPSTATTIIGTYGDPSGERVTLMAHYDTKMDTPGAADNAASVAALLVLVDVLCQRDYPFALEFIAFGDEDYYAYSDGMYVAKNGDRLKNIILALNMDGMGQKLGTNTIAIFSASDELRRMVDEVLSSYPAVIWTDPWPQSNHSTFAYRGVPSLAFMSKGVTNLHHQPYDTLDWIQPDKCQEVIRLIVDIIDHLKDRNAGWTRGENSAS